MGRKAASFGSVCREVAPPRPFSDGAVRVTAAPEWAGISRSLLFSWMKSGSLPWSRPSRERLVCRATLRFLLERHAGGL